MTRLLLGPDDYEKNTGRNFQNDMMEIAYGEPKYPIKRRERIDSSLRLEVYERDGYRCQNCGSRKRLSLDHIVPFSRGGETTLNNLQTLCKSCNSSKGNRT